MKKKLLILILVVMIVSSGVALADKEPQVEGLELKSEFVIEPYVYRLYESDNGETVFFYKKVDEVGFRVLSIHDKDGKLLYKYWH